MNKRQQQKMATRAKLVSTARELFAAQGFLNTTTAQIAKSSGVAHGTLFVHFATREHLMVEVLDREMEALSDRLGRQMAVAGGFFDLLERYLDFLTEHEGFFSSLWRELPLYPDELRRKVMFRYAGIQTHFHRALSASVSAGEVPPCDANLVVQTLFAQLHYYLSLRTLFVEDGSVVARFRGRLRTLARLLTACGDDGEGA